MVTRKQMPKAAKSNHAGRVSKDSPQYKLKYKPQGPTLREFHAQRTFVRRVIGPLGSGKTFAAINHCLMRSHTQTPDKDGVRRSRGCVARNTFPDLASATIPDWRTITDHLPHGTFTMGSPPKWVAKYDRSDGTKVEVEVLFRAFDGPQDVKKARGMQLTWIWIDELGEFPKTNFDMLLGRVKRYPPKVMVPNAKWDAVFTSNAVPRDHWLAELAHNQPANWWIGIQPGGVIRVGNRWVENPQAENLNNLATNYYTDQMGGKKESWIRQNLANEFVHHSDGRPIHPDFNEQFHVDTVVAIPGLPLHLGMDWGRTPACVIMQRQVNGQWFIIEEVCLTNAGADKLGSTVKRVLNARFQGFTIERATGDPTGGNMSQADDSTPFELFDLNSSLTADPAHTNDPEVRFATLDNLLTTILGGQPAIVVDRSCTILIAGLSGEYQFKRIQISGEERYHDEPNKDPTSHVCEALHYGLMGAGESDVLFNQGYDDMMSDLEDLAPDPSMFE
jgi:hypothetical protein